MTQQKEYPTGPLTPLFRQMSRLERFRMKNDRKFGTLTKREVLVLTHIAEGKSNPEIAEMLELSRATIQNHRAHIRNKLHIQNDTDFVTFGLAFELIEI